MSKAVSEVARDELDGIDGMRESVGHLLLAPPPSPGRAQLAHSAAGDDNTTSPHDDANVVVHSHFTAAA